jgi:hypothetical protein
LVLRFVLAAAAFSAYAADAPQKAGPGPQPQADTRRVDLNLLGKTDAAAGESRRNENIQFNLIDNNALKELNVRLGVTATLIEEFRPERGYFGAEYGNAPSAVLHATPLRNSGLHGSAYEAHQNSVFGSRSFFQAGDVKPAHDNDYGFTLAAPGWRKFWLTLEGSQQKQRGSVNGNVLVPAPGERTPLATDPAVRAVVARFLAAYPAELPNRTDINPRALNTNSPQSIDNNNGGIRLDRAMGARDRLLARYQFTAQHVEAFQLVAGQNPNTDTRAHTGRLTWVRAWNAALVSEFSAGFDRVGSLLAPEKNAVGPLVSTSGLESLGPLAGIPIDRAQNLYRYAGQLKRGSGSHTVIAGFLVTRRQLNGFESDAHRGYFSFANDFGRDAVTNLRLGIPTQHIIAIGNIYRGYRNWEMQYYAGDTWRARPSLTLSYGLRYQPVATPSEVNHLNEFPYGCDCLALAPRLGLAWRLPRGWGVVRANYGTHRGEIFPVTYQQVRFSTPLNHKIVVTAPDLLHPLQDAVAAAPTTYVLAPDLVSPYAHQYNFSWETRVGGEWNVQLGYVGSRQHKLLTMWYLNRAHPVPGIDLTTATINQRRADTTMADIRWVLNGSRGYFDAARASLVVPRWRGLSLDASYWFSKAMDMGSGYTNTAFDGDSRLARSQSEFESHRDLRALSSFDQPHAFLSRGSWQFRGFLFSAVLLLKSGTPFNVGTGSDAPGFGNVDGNGSDRPHLLDPSILGRTIGHPDDSRALLPRSAFAFLRPGEESGNLGRNVFRKGGIRNWNAAVSHTWTVGAEKRLTVRAESINFSNTPQFAEPGAELAQPNFGYITNTLNDGRTFRFTVQAGF